MADVVQDLNFLTEGIVDTREYLALERLLLFAQSQAEGLEDTPLASLCREAAEECNARLRAAQTQAPAKVNCSDIQV